MGGSFNMEYKGCESIGCWTHYVTVSYDLDLGFSRSNFEKTVSLEWGGRLTHIVALNFDLSHNLDLEFSRSNFDKAVLSEWHFRYFRLFRYFDSPLVKSCNVTDWVTPLTLVTIANPEILPHCLLQWLTSQVPSHLGHQMCISRAWTLYLIPLYQHNMNTTIVLLYAEASVLSILKLASPLSMYNATRVKHFI